MGNYPILIPDRPTPLYDVLKERETIILEKPLVTMLDGFHGQGILPPRRGAGLETGRAGERRAGNRRGFLERLKRHNE